MASQITSLTSVYSIVYSEAIQRKYQSSTTQTLVRGIHWWPLISSHIGPVTRKMFQFDNVTMFVDIHYWVADWLIHRWGQTKYNTLLFSVWGDYLFPYLFCPLFIDYRSIYIYIYDIFLTTCLMYSFTDWFIAWSFDLLSSIASVIYHSNNNIQQSTSLCSCEIIILLSIFLQTNPKYEYTICTSKHICLYKLCKSLFYLLWQNRKMQFAANALMKSTHIFTLKVQNRTRKIW